MSEKDATFNSKLCADFQLENNGEDIENWESPENVADEEMSCWNC